VEKATYRRGCDQTEGEQAWNTMLSLDDSEVEKSELNAEKFAAEQRS
jgi:hypothetical protein